MDQLKDQVERLTKERNILAQKLVDAEGAKNDQRRASLTSAQIPKSYSESPMNKDLNKVFY
jgi:hypothetical protein